jgi:hypothetical protein
VLDPGSIPGSSTDGPQFSVFLAATSDDAALMDAGLETAKKSLAAPPKTRPQSCMFACAGGYTGVGLKILGRERGAF